jgi:hypothetical protein
VKILFVPPKLKDLDQLLYDFISFSIFEDERPLKGIGGLIDWRLNGMLSRLLITKKLEGKRGEKLLIPLFKRMSFKALLVFGLGKKMFFDEDIFTSVLYETFETIQRLKGSTLVLGLPGRAQNSIEPIKALSLFLKVTKDIKEYDEVTLIEPLKDQKIMKCYIL